MEKKEDEKNWENQLKHDKKINKNKIMVITIISLLIVSLIVVSIVAINLAIKNKKNEKEEEIQIAKTKDNSEKDSSELIDYFKKEGYSLYISEISSPGTSITYYVSLDNKNLNISIQKIMNQYSGTLYTFKDSTVNNEYADIDSESANTTTEDRKQYMAYKQWLKRQNISTQQLESLLTYYYYEHKNDEMETHIVGENTIYSVTKEK